MALDLSTALGAMTGQRYIQGLKDGREGVRIQRRGKVLVPREILPLVDVRLVVLRVAGGGAVPECVVEPGNSARRFRCKAPSRRLLSNRQIDSHQRLAAIHHCLNAYNVYP